MFVIVLVFEFVSVSGFVFLNELVSESVFSIVSEFVFVLVL